ncbi:MAG TPA: NAD(P)-dependent oxidoreductase [Steroidobacteraceae bacterium]|nr:NAD(P)-dependent oxidoreductase [Steroidobacteraceae bacterium]
MSKRIFVAGASGAIGRPLCKLLDDDGYIVFGTTRNADKAEVLKALGVTPVVVDVYDANRLKDIVVDIAPDVVMHQLTDLPYALDSAKMAEARVKNARLREEGTRNLVEAAIAAKVKKLIAQSIAFAYAPGTPPFDEFHALNVNSSDEMAAMSASAVASLEHQVLNGPFEGVVLRYGKLYGPGTGFDNAPSGGPVHVDAAADAARKAMAAGVVGVFNVAEDDGAVNVIKARDVLGWNPTFRIS